MEVLFARVPDGAFAPTHLAVRGRTTVRAGPDLTSPDVGRLEQGEEVQQISNVVMMPHATTPRTSDSSPKRNN